VIANGREEGPGGGGCRQGWPSRGMSGRGTAWQKCCSLVSELLAFPDLFGCFASLFLPSAALELSAVLHRPLTC
jgi:hypothetical protein